MKQNVLRIKWTFEGKRRGKLSSSLWGSSREETTQKGPQKPRVPLRADLQTIAWFSTEQTGGCKYRVFPLQIEGVHRVYTLGSLGWLALIA